MPRIPRRKHTNFPYCKVCREYRSLEAGQVHHIGDINCRLYKPTLLPDEIERPNVDRQNNIIIGIAVGVMVVACSLILLVMFINK